MPKNKKIKTQRNTTRGSEEQERIGRLFLKKKEKNEWIGKEKGQGGEE
jgi:hypothetical protein